MTESNEGIEARVAADERYRAFIANSTEGIWRLDLKEPVPVSLSEEEQIEAFYRHGFLAEANDALARMYGYGCGEELIGAPLGNFLIRDDPANGAYLRAFIRSGYRLADAESVETDRHGGIKHFSNTLTGMVQHDRLVRAWGTQRDITAQRAAEAERERLLAQLGAVLQTATDGIIVSDPEGNLLMWNPAALALHGYDNPGDAARPLAAFADTFDLFLPADSSEPLPLEEWPLARVMRGETFTNCELLVRRRDRDQQWWASYSGAPARGADGKTLLLVLTVRDVSEQVRTREALRAKSDEVNAILESIGDAFFALDGEWRFTYVNAEAERLLLRGRGELLGRSLWEEFPAAIGSDFEWQYRRAAGERVTVVFQAYYPPPLDSWYDVRAYPSPTGAGLSVYFRNINEERRREQEREQLLAELEVANARQQESLQQSEERFRLLVEGVQDYAIFMLDPEGCITTWNAGAQRFKGYRAEEIIGQHFSRFYTPEDIARRHPWNELEIAIREGRYEEEGWRVRKDGTRFWASVVITALRDEKGQLRGFGKVTRDFTERRLREQERASAQALEQQRHFLKDILQSVTEGKLRLCSTPLELPPPLSPEPAGGAIPLSRDALKTLRAEVAGVAALCAMPKDSLQDLLTAASECAMNAVQHAGGGVARVYGDAAAGRVQVWVEDSGKGIDLSQLPRATLEPGFSTGGGGIGHGFLLMISCCERVYLLTGTGGTTVVLERSRQAPMPSWFQTVKPPQSARPDP